MKMRKVLLTLTAVVLLVTILAVPALAGTFDLTMPPDWQNNDNQQGWRTNTCDGETTTLELATLQNATSLVIEISVAPDADRFDLVWQGDANAWGWKEFKLNPADYYADGKITLNFADFAVDGKAIFDCAENGKFLIAFWNGEWANVTNAYLVTKDAATTTNPKDGDSMLIFLALGVLALASCATVLVVRKVKA